MAEMERDRWLLANDEEARRRQSQDGAEGPEQLPSHGREVLGCCQAIAPALALIVVALVFTLLVPVVIHITGGGVKRPKRTFTGSTLGWTSTTAEALVGDGTRPSTTVNTAVFSTSVFLTMRLENLDYNFLAAHGSMPSEVRRLVAEEVAAAARHGVTPADVAVVLSPGSVVAGATVTPPDPSSVEEVRKALRFSTTLGISLAARLSSLPEIRSASIGDVTVDNIRFPAPTTLKAVLGAATTTASRTTRIPSRGSSEPPTHMPPQTSTPTSTQTVPPTSTTTITLTSTRTFTHTTTSRTSTLTSSATSSTWTTQTSTQTSVPAAAQSVTRAPVRAELTETTTTTPKPATVTTTTAVTTPLSPTTGTATTTTVTARPTETATTTSTRRTPPAMAGTLESHWTTSTRSPAAEVPEPSSVTTTGAEIASEEVLGPELDLPSSAIVYNNLGGMGPLSDEPEELRYGQACFADGIPVDVELVALSSYRPQHPDLNGLRGKYPNVNLAAGSFVDLSLQFVQSHSEIPVELGRVYLKIFDVDTTHKDLVARREVLVNGFDKYVSPIAYRFSHVSKISITLHAIKRDSGLRGRDGRNFMLALYTGQSCVSAADLPTTTAAMSVTTRSRLRPWAPVVAAEHAVSSLAASAIGATTYAPAEEPVWGYRVEPHVSTTAAGQEQQGSSASPGDLEALRRTVAAAAKSAGEFGRSATSAPSVPLTLTVRNVDYALLMERPTLVSAFKASIKRAISAEAGNGITPASVRLALSPGSIIVWAAVYPSRGNFFAVQSALGYSMTLAGTLRKEVVEMGGIASVSTGPISVVGVNVPPFSTRTTTKAVSSTTTTASTTTITSTQSLPATRIGSVPLSMKIENLDYHRLSKDPARLHEFRANMKEAIALEAGYGTRVSGVSLILSEIAPHVLFVQASVTPTSNVILSLVRSRLSKTTSLSGTVAAWVEQVRGIEAYMDGPLGVSEIGVVWSSPPASPPAVMLPGWETSTTSTELGSSAMKEGEAPQVALLATTVTRTTTTIVATTDMATTTSTSATTTTATSTDTVTTVTATATTATITWTTATVTGTATSTTVTSTTMSTTTATTTTTTHTSTTQTTTTMTFTLTTSSTTTTTTTTTTSTSTTSTTLLLEMTDKERKEGVLPMDGGPTDSSHASMVTPSVVWKKGPVAGVPVSMTVQNVDYRGLVRDASLLEAFNATIQDAIAKSAGPSVFPDDVAMVLLPGSVLVRALVAPDGDVDLDDVRWQLLSASSSLGKSVAARLADLEGITTAQTGTIAVANVTVSGVIIVGTPAPKVAAHAAESSGFVLWKWLLAPFVLLAMCCCVPALGFILRRLGFKPGGQRANGWQRQDAWYKPVDVDTPPRSFLPASDKALAPQRLQGAGGPSTWPEVRRRPSFISEAYGQPSLEALAHGLPARSGQPTKNQDAPPVPGSWPRSGSGEEDFLGGPVVSPMDSYPPPPPPPRRPQHVGHHYLDEDATGNLLDSSNGHNLSSSAPYYARDLPLIDLRMDSSQPRSDSMLQRSTTQQLPESDSALMKPARAVVTVEGAIVRSSSPYERVRAGSFAAARPAAVVEAAPLRVRSRSASPSRVAVVEGGPMRVVRGTGVARRSLGVKGYVAPLPSATAPAVRHVAPVPLQPQPLTLPGAMQTLPSQVVGQVLQRPPQFADPATSAVVSSATVGLDLNLNGRTDVIVTGPDLNRDGIPDVLQQHAGTLAAAPRAASNPAVSSTGAVVDRMLRMG